MMLALDFHGLVNADFWIGAGVFAAVYGIFTLGLQLNLGVTGVYNFGQVGYQAVGAYAAALLVVKAGWPLWASMLAATLLTTLAGVVTGLTALRLRANYFAVTTLAFAEIIRLVITNADGLTNGSRGVLGFDGDWQQASAWISSHLAPLGLDRYQVLPLLIVAWLALGLLAAALWWLARSPWGRVLRAIREDDLLAQALGKNVFSYRLQSLAIAAALGSVSGCVLALDLSFLSPGDFTATFSFIGFTTLLVGGWASFGGVAVGSALLWILLEGTRFIGLPLPDDKVAALRYLIVGVVLILLAAFRPQGLLGRRVEVPFGDA
jgi:branched-chain amino acid transport system permease protein